MGHSFGNFAIFESVGNSSTGFVKNDFPKKKECVILQAHIVSAKADFLRMKEEPDMETKFAVIDENNIDKQQDDVEIYNIYGQRINGIPNTQGIYIVDRKKYTLQELLRQFYIDN